MLTSKMLTSIIAEARPIIERQLDDADRIAGIRDKFTAEGGDWGALKALVKSRIQDERDETGDGKRVGKILTKADASSAYADMLGWANLNEKNSFAEDDDAELSGLEALDPDLLHLLIEGSKSEAGLTIIRNALAVVQGTTEPGMVPVAEADLHNPRNATASASHSEPTSNGTDAPVPSGAAEELPDSSAPIQPETAALPLSTEPALEQVLSGSPAELIDRSGHEQGVRGAGGASNHPGGDHANSGGKAVASHASLTSEVDADNEAQDLIEVLAQDHAAEGTGGVTHPSLVPAHNPETHFLNSKGLLRLQGCLNPEVCGASKPREKLCFSCSVRHDGPVHQPADAVVH